MEEFDEEEMQKEYFTEKRKKMIRKQNALKMTEKEKDREERKKLLKARKEKKK